MCVKVCACKEGKVRVSLLGLLLSLHSLKLLFYKGPCLAERGKPARVKRKRRATPVKDATVAMRRGNTVVYFGVW